MPRYHGHVSPGGDAAVHELAHLIVTKLAVGEHAANTYLLRCRDTGDELLVDAAADAERILATCGDGPLVRVVTTDRDRHHWAALEQVVEATGAATVAHVDAAAAIAVPTTEPVRDGDDVRVGDCTLSVIHLRGHTPGGIALLYDDPTGPPHLWTGDSLLANSLGSTTSADELATLRADVESKVFARLPYETWIYPGHGDDTTLGALRVRIERSR